MQMKMLKMYEMYARKSETLTERAIKDGSLTQKGGRKETYKELPTMRSGVFVFGYYMT